MDHLCAKEDRLRTIESKVGVLEVKVDDTRSDIKETRTDIKTMKDNQQKMLYWLVTTLVSTLITFLTIILRGGRV